VSYCRPWFLWPETKKLVIPFLRIYLISSLLSVHCVSPHRRSHKPRWISTLKTKYHLLWLPPRPQPIIEHGSLIKGRSQDGAMIEDFKYLSEGKIFRYLLYLYHLFARGRATSKHGGGGRYNEILEFKGEQIKKLWERKRKKWEKERKKEKYEYEKKKKKEREEKIWVCVKIK
jgi:hypothetical protein